MAFKLSSLIPPMDFGTLRRSLVLRQGRRAAEEHLWPVLEMVGQENIRWLVANGKSLIEKIPPATMENIHAGAPQYKWAADALADGDIVHLLPPWLVEIVAEAGEPGREWLLAETARIRGLFRGKEA